MLAVGEMRRERLGGAQELETERFASSPGSERVIGSGVRKRSRSWVRNSALADRA